MASKVFEYIAAEEQRQQNTVELIASENFVSEDVLRAVGSCLTNKYSEGYPAQREMATRVTTTAAAMWWTNWRNTACRSGRKCSTPTTM